MRVQSCGELSRLKITDKRSARPVNERAVGRVSLKGEQLGVEKTTTD